MIFRGDLIHSRVGFDDDEVSHRLHCYLTVGDKEWEPDVVQEVKGAGILLPILWYWWRRFGKDAQSPPHLRQKPKRLVEQDKTTQA